MAVRERAVWWAMAAIAVITGIYFRSIGIGKWPLATDEYYLFQSVTFIRETGLPEFPCGGFYARGLLIQYLLAGLLGLPFSAEGVMRSVSAICNLLTLPAVFLLGRRLGGERVALAAIIVVSLSVWEIEMARFARMYAPFQMLFAWYCYHAWRLVDDRDLTRWRWLLVLSAVAPLVWEGGITLAALNVVVLLTGRENWNRAHAAWTVAIIVFAVAFLSTNFRFLGAPLDESMLPPSVDAGSAGRIGNVPVLWASEHLSGLAQGVLAFLASAALILAIRATWKLRAATASVVLLILAVSLALNQVLLSAMLLVGALLVGWIRPADVARQPLSPAAVAVGVLAIAWFAVTGIAAVAGESRDAILALVGFPDLRRSLVWPWLGTLPAMAVLLSAGIVLAFLRIVASEDRSRHAAGLMLAFVLSCVAIIGAVRTEYEETRYSFHLYPLLLLLALYGYGLLVGRLRRDSGWIAGVPALIFLPLFLATNDFSFAHVRNIDAYEANFRVGYADRRARHYYPRFDFRSPAEYVDERAAPDDVIVVTDVVLAVYMDDVDYTYLATSDGRYRGRVCGDGSTERWSDLPLLDSPADLTEVIRARSGAAWLLVDSAATSRSLPGRVITEEMGLREVYRAPDGFVAVYRTPD